MGYDSGNTWRTSLEQLQRIKHRRPNFESDYWNALRLDLQYRLLHLVRRKCGGLLPTDDERLDFVLHYLHRTIDEAVLSGSLLSSWDEQSQPLLPCMGPLHVWRAAKEWKRKNGFISQSGDAPPVDYCLTPVGATRRFRTNDQLLLNLAAAIEGIALVIPDNSITQPVVDAGLQLFPRIDWHSGNLRVLLEQVREQIRTSSNRDPLEILGLEHEAAACELLNRIDELAKKILAADASRSRRSARGIQRLRLLQDKARLELVFWPLSAAVLMRIQKGVDSRNVADQRKRRYLKLLPRLIPTIVAFLQTDEEEEI